MDYRSKADPLLALVSSCPSTATRLPSPCPSSNGEGLSQRERESDRLQIKSIQPAHSAFLLPSSVSTFYSCHESEDIKDSLAGFVQHVEATQGIDQARLSRVANFASPVTHHKVKDHIKKEREELLDGIADFEGRWVDRLWSFVSLPRLQRLAAKPMLPFRRWPQ